MQRSIRLKTIMTAVRAPGGVRVSDLAEATGVSPMTIRRDLADLERRGMVRRSHGRAIGLPTRGTRLPFAMRLDSNMEQKTKIAAWTAELIPDGSSIIIDTGTTCTAVAHALAGRDLTALVLSVPAATVLGERPGTRIITPGGELDTDELTWTGHRAIREINEFHADYAVLGVCAWDETSGLTAATMHDADLKKALLDSARHVIAASTGDKLGTSATFAVCPSENIHTLVTRDISKQCRDWVTVSGVDIIDEPFEAGH